MKTSALWLLSSLLILNVQAQTPAPKPGAEQKKLEVWAGDWKYTGTSYPTPLGKAGKFVGTQKVRMILNGFFLETRWEDKGDYEDEKGVVSQGVEIDSYDPVKKNYPVFGWENDGASSTGSMTVDGSTWKSSSTRTGSDGKTYQIRGVTTFTEDGKRATWKLELSPDGVSWIPWLEGINTKTRSGR
jgi:hypothetical protein